MLARGSGSAQVLLSMRWTYPTILFWLLRHPEVLCLILADPECLWDDYTREHMRQFRDRLLSKESIGVLLAAAVLLKVDICVIECRHASLRRLVLQLSNQCPRARTALVGSIFGLARLGDLLQKGVMPKPEVEVAGNIIRPKRTYKTAGAHRARVKCRNLKSKRPRNNKYWRHNRSRTRYNEDGREHRGGGAWKVFDSDSLRRRKASGLDFRRLSAKYWAVNPDAKRDLLERGAKATKLAAAGRCWTAIMNTGKPKVQSFVHRVPFALAETRVRVWDGDDLVEKIPLEEVQRRISKFDKTSDALASAGVPFAPGGCLSTLEKRRWQTQAENVVAEHCPEFS